MTTDQIIACIYCRRAKPGVLPFGTDDPKQMEAHWRKEHPDQLTSYERHPSHHG